MNPIRRKATRAITVGGVAVGGGAPVTVQSMTNTPTPDVAATVAQIRRLEAAGCDIVRVAVPDDEAADALSRIKAQVRIPVRRRHPLRPPPGHRGRARPAPTVCGSTRATSAAPERCARSPTAPGSAASPSASGSTPGSLEKDILKKYSGATPEALVESALRAHRAAARRSDFRDLKVSVKASDVPRTVAAYRLLSPRTDCRCTSG